MRVGQDRPCFFRRFLVLLLDCKSRSVFASAEAVATRARVETSRAHLMLVEDRIVECLSCEKSQSRKVEILTKVFVLLLNLSS